MHLDPFQDGCYRRLIDHYMETRQPLPDNDVALARIVGITIDEWAGKARDILRPFFQSADNKLYHKTCDENLAEQDGRSSKRKDVATLGAHAKWKNEQEERKEANKRNRSERLSAARRLGTHTKDEWRALVLYCRSTCCKCGAECDVVKDHIKPIYQGGSDAIDNLQPLCRRCNSAKGPEKQDHRPSGWRECLLPSATRQDKTIHNKLAGAEKREIVISTDASVRPAKPGEDGWNPERHDGEVLPGGWDEEAQKSGLANGRVYESWGRFKERSDRPFERKRWVGWLGVERRR